jgi:SAM-dependent methyltransferase
VGFWSTWFRLGAYDFLMPINYDHSIRDALAWVIPRTRGRLVDFGCGNGRLLVHAAPWLKTGATYLGVDIDEAGLRAARRRASQLGIARQVTFAKRDIREPEPLPSRFDCGLAHYSIYTLGAAEDRAAALTNLTALLVPGARATVSVPSERYRIAAIIADARRAEDERTDAGTLTRKLRKHGLYRLSKWAMHSIERQLDEGRFHRFTRSELADALSQAGFTEISVVEGYGGCGYHARGVRP